MLSSLFLNASPKLLLQKQILSWYDRHARQFIWRERHDTSTALSPPDPYIVLVSEVMLQQTQTARIQEKLPLFLQQFPTVEALAVADNATIIKAWEGIGYNSRALRLRDCARAILERHQGTIPSSESELLALPGIGPYTASAIRAFAYHHDVAVLDVNIRRVYSRLLSPMATTADVLAESAVQAFAETVYPSGEASRWHQAVMDIGALFCTARSPKCRLCPLFELCPSADKMSEKQKEKRPEPLWRGVPNRIWRGRLVQLLRTLDEEQYMKLEDISAKLFPTTLFQSDEEKQHTEWLWRLLQGLERDSIVEVVRETEDTKQETDSSQPYSKISSNPDFIAVTVRLSSKS